MELTDVDVTTTLSGLVVTMTVVDKMVVDPMTAEDVVSLEVFGGGEEVVGVLEGVLDGGGVEVVGGGVEVEGVGVGVWVVWEGDEEDEVDLVVAVPADPEAVA